MRFCTTAALITFLCSAVLGAQTEWTTPSAIQSGQPGEAVVVVERIDASGRRIAASFVETDFSVNLNVNSGTRFRGFGEAGVDTIGFGGLGEVTEGDTIRVFGTGGSTGVIQAEDLRLLGRQLTSTDAPAIIEGVVRSVNREENVFTVESGDRRLWTIAGESTTPVEFGDRSFAIANLETGDVVRVSIAGWDEETPLASTVMVTSDSRGAGGLVTSVSGRVTALRPAADRLVLESARGDRIVVDISGSTGESGERFTMTDLALGDELDITGRQMADGTFRAAIIRDLADGDAGLQPLRSIELRGTVLSGPDEEGWVRIEGEAGTVDVLTDPDQPVRLPDSRWSSPSSLRDGDAVYIRGIDAGGGAVIAQVIEVSGEE